MAFPTNVDADPDPTTQIPWPGARKRSDDRLDRRTSSTRHTDSGHDRPTYPENDSTSTAVEDEPTKRRMSTMDLFNISISMAGAQIAWSVELG